MLEQRNKFGSKISRMVAELNDHVLISIKAAYRLKFKPKIIPPDRPLKNKFIKLKNNKSNT